MHQMIGAVDALGIGSVLIGPGARIVSCCSTFATLTGRSSEELVGVSVATLVEEADYAAGRWLMNGLWMTGESFTFLSRYARPVGSSVTMESRVMRLYGGEASTAIILTREFTCRPDAPVLHHSATAEYVADMAEQLAEMASHSSMPITCDLLGVCVHAAKREAALPEQSGGQGKSA